MIGGGFAIMSIKLVNVCLSFGDRVILDSVTQELKKGFCLLFGPSGAGKSTLLRVLNMLISPDTGEITYNGKSIYSFKPSLWRSRCLLVKQKTTLVEGSVMYNIELPFSFKANRDRRLDRKLLEELCERFALPEELLQSEAMKLSGGEAQRVAIIRAILLGADVYLFDEPTSALDEHSADAVFEYIKRLSESRLCVVASHSQRAFGYADEVYRLEGGKLRNG